MRITRVHVDVELHQGQQVELPAAAANRKIKLEFRLTTDDIDLGPQYGWFIDDVSLVETP